MNRFAALLDALTYQPQRTLKLRLLTDYLSTTPDPDRGYALAAMTGGLEFQFAKPALIRTLITERTDSTLFALSYDYVGDLAETVALMWPSRYGANSSPKLGEIVDTLRSIGKSSVSAQLAAWLDALDASGRWALIKLITGGLRVGVSSRLAKTAAAALKGVDVNEIEGLWPGLSPPYTDLFAWLTGHGPKPTRGTQALFRPVMLAHALDESILATLNPADYAAEWKWDGIRVQAVHEHGQARIFSRSGEDISKSFPELLDSVPRNAVIDGELLIVRDGGTCDFNTLQQRLNRKSVTPKLIDAFPALIRAYDLLVLEARDLTSHSFEQRRRALEALIALEGNPRLDLSPLVPFETWPALAAARLGPPDPAIEGLMLKRRDGAYQPGRVTGLWWKWKRDPFIVDAVLMYAQRGHGKRSSYYSDYTFGVWRDSEVVPVGKAYFGFTDDELKRIDAFVRANTVDRFGPVRVVTHTPDDGLVFEVAFEGLARSPRHKSGLAMRFPRISRLRWDKRPKEADTLDSLSALLPKARELQNR